MVLGTDSLLDTLSYHFSQRIKVTEVKEGFVSAYNVTVEDSNGTEFTMGVPEEVMKSAVNNLLADNIVRIHQFELKSMDFDGENLRIDFDVSEDIR
ncbi:MAG: hypothetical protein KC483_04330 [Nitrosarchaeum sp.]|nr:hypothetical protein [Nitrosarchaeum sp.]